MMLINFSKLIIYLLFLLSISFTSQAGNESELKQIDKSIRLREYSLAVKQLQTLIQQNDAEAQFRMAGLYRSGKGIQKDRGQALLLYEKAAMQGHADAQYALASLLEKKGAKEEAENWYQQAADQGQYKARKKLALLKQSDNSANIAEISSEKVLSSIRHNDLELIRSLLKNNYNFNIQDKASRNPLLVALLAGHEEMSLLLLPVTKQLDHADEYNSRAMHVASTNGFNKIIEQLIAQNVDINTQDDLGSTALMIALRHDDADIVDLLLTHDADYRLKNKNGKTALDIARTRAQFNISTLFAKHDIKLKSPNNQYAKLDLESFQQSINQSTSVYKGWPLLSVASLLGEKEIVVQLINQGAKVNDRDASGYSALHRAASKGQTENINLLLANGARINMLNHKKETPLFLAAESGQFKTVKLLLKKGADTSILSEIKSSALLVSIANNHEKTAAILAPGKLDGKSIHRALTQSVISNMQDISLVLIKKDKLINQLDNNKRSTLWLSANLGRKKVVSALLREQSIELDQPDINGYSPLARSILNGHVIISKQLIARGTSLETMTSENNSLLMLSVLSEKIELTKILLDKGVNVDTKNKAGDSALMLASSAGNNDMVEMLINAGANIQTRNLDDLNAYQIALNAGHNKTAELIRDHSGKLFKIFN